MAMEVSKAGKFDDVLYHQSSSISRTIFIQSKHKLLPYAELLNIKRLMNFKDPYGIPEYFLSFVETGDIMPEDARFVLCTNAILDKEAMEYFTEARLDDSLQFTKDIGATCFELESSIDDILTQSCLAKFAKDVTEQIIKVQKIYFNNTIFNIFANLFNQCIEPLDEEPIGTQGKKFKLTADFLNLEMNKTPSTDKEKFAHVWRTELDTQYKKSKESKMKKAPTKKWNIFIDKASFDTAIEQDKDKFSKKKDEFVKKFLLIRTASNHKELRIKVRNLLPEWCDEAQRELVIDNLVGLLNNNVYNKPRYYITLERIQQWFLDKDFNQNISVLKRLSEEHLKSVLEKHPHIEVNPERLKEFKLYEVLKESGPGIYEFNSTLELTVYSRILFQALSLLQYETIFVDSAKYTEQQNMNDVLEDLLSYLRDVNHPTIKIITILGKPDYVSINELKELSDKYSQKIVVVKHISGSPQNDEISERIYVKDLSDTASDKLYKKTVRMMFGTNTPMSRIVEENDDLSFLLNVLELCDLSNELKDRNVNEHNYEKIKHWYVRRGFEKYEQNEEIKAEKYEENKGHEGGRIEEDDMLKDALIANTYEPYPLGLQKANSEKVFIFLNAAGHGKTTYFTWLSWRLSTYRQVETQLPFWYVITFFGMELTNFHQLIGSNNDETEIVSQNNGETEIVRLLYRYILLALFVSYDKCTIKETDGFRDKADRCANLLNVSNGEIVLDETKTKTLTTIELFELRLFKEKFNKKEIILILDGVDELVVDCKHDVMNCFAQFAKLDAIRCMYLSTRSDEFAQNLKTKFIPSNSKLCEIYRLKAFLKKDVIRLIHNYFVNNVNGYESRKEECQIKLLKNVFECIYDVFKNKTYVPLFLYIVLIFLLPEFKKSFNGNRSPISSNVLTNAKQQMHQLVQQYVNELRCDLINEQHIRMTMCVAFNKNEGDKVLFQQENKRTKEILRNLKHDETNGVLQFMRQAYAECVSSSGLYEYLNLFFSNQEAMGGR